MKKPKILFIDPKPQCRPRFRRNGRPYYPETMKKYLAALKNLLQVAYQDHDKYPSDKPLKLKVCFYLRKPKSAIKEKRDFPINPKAGDVDNYAKAFMDCATKALVYSDDVNVVTLEARRRYHKFGCIVFEIEEEKDLYPFNHKWLDFGNRGQVNGVFDAIKNRASS